MCLKLNVFTPVVSLPSVSVDLGSLPDIRYDPGQQDFCAGIEAQAFTEPDTGSDPLQLKTSAKKVDGGWLINGSKRFITNSGICDYMILFAKAENCVAAFLVEAKGKGYEILLKMETLGKIAFCVLFVGVAEIPKGDQLRCNEDPSISFSDGEEGTENI